MIKNAAMLIIKSTITFDHNDFVLLSSLINISINLLSRKLFAYFSGFWRRKILITLLALDKILSQTFISIVD